MSQAMRAFGTTIKVNDKLVGELQTIGLPGFNADTVEVTHHGSPDAFRAFLQTLRDGGELKLEGNYIPGDTGQQELAAAFGSSSFGTPADIFVTLPDGSTWECDAVVTQYQPSEATIDGVLKFTATLKVSGKPVFTAVGS